MASCILWNTLAADSLLKSETCIALKCSLSILTFLAVVCDPNKTNPFVFKWAAICAGPVSFAITNALSLINVDSWEIFKAFSLCSIVLASISFAILISFGPGAIITWYLSLNFSLIFAINSL